MCYYLRGPSEKQRPTTQKRWPSEGAEATIHVAETQDPPSELFKRIKTVIVSDGPAVHCSWEVQPNSGSTSSKSISLSLRVEIAAILRKDISTNAMWAVFAARGRPRLSYREQVWSTSVGSLQHNPVCGSGRQKMHLIIIQQPPTIQRGTTKKGQTNSEPRGGSQQKEAKKQIRGAVRVKSHIISDTWIP